jgi:TolB-like protein/Flp pilus assembly protein TadD
VDLNDTGQAMFKRFWHFWRELRRRRVPHAAGIYLAGSWLLLQVFDVALIQIGLPQWVMALAVWLAFIGFPVALLASWRYEITRDGIRRTAPPVLASGADLSIRLADYLLISIILIFLVLVSISLTHMLKNGPPDITGSDASPKSIAVLPFENMSGQEENEYFSRGLAEDILHRLALIDELRVTSRTASFELDTTNLDMATIGQRLGVKSLLEGSVRRIGDRVRIVAQLIDAETGYHIWSRSYDRDIEDLFGIYDEISTAVVNELQLTLAPDTRVLVIPPTNDMEAYDYFLQARSMLQRSTHAESAANAQKFFAKSVAKDPYFAQAWAGQCQAFLTWHIYEPDAERLESARASCRKSLELDPELLEAHVAMGDMYRNTGQYNASIAEYDTALIGDASLAMAWRGLGQAYAETGKPIEAENAMIKAVELEPDDLANFVALGSFYFARGQYAEAAQIYGRMAAHPKAGASAFNGQGASYYMLGDFQKAASAYRQVIETEPTASAFSNIGGMYYYNGQFEDAVIMYREAVELSPENPVWWGNLGDGLREIEGENEEAQRAYAKAARLTETLVDADPEDVELLTNLAHYAARLGNDTQARKYLELALNASPEDVYAHYYASLVHLEAGRLEQSMQEIIRSVELGYPVVLLRSDPQFNLHKTNQKFIELVGEEVPYD